MSTADNNKTGMTGTTDSYKVKIASDVIARIAGIAALDVDGVEAVAGNLNRETISKCNRSTLRNGVRIELVSGACKADLSLIMEYGYTIPDICRQVQKKVSQTITSMTGLKVIHVNVGVTGIAAQKS